MTSIKKEQTDAIGENTASCMLLEGGGDIERHSAVDTAEGRGRVAAVRLHMSRQLARLCACITVREEKINKTCIFCNRIFLLAKKSITIYRPTQTCSSGTCTVSRQCDCACERLDLTDF